MFCGNCGTKLKDGKCPKCDKKETKKTTKTEKVKAEKVKAEPVKEVKEEKVNFGWFVLGFFVPVAGFIIFLVFMNKNKKISKTSGLGALIGVIKNIIIIVLYYVLMFFSIFSIYNYINRYIVPNDVREIWDYDYNRNYDDDNELDDDKDYSDYIDTIEISGINTKELLPELEYSINSFRDFGDNEYKFERNGISVIRNKDQVTIKDYEDNKILFTYNNVKKAYYHEFDCSGLDTIVIVTNDKAYYIKTDMHVNANIKAVEIKGNYKDFYYTYNHSYTCGGSIIALGKGLDGNFYDLNGEAIIYFDNLYYYEDPNNWIDRNRNSRLNGGEGSVKAVVVSSVTTKIYGFIDSYGYAYSYVYDNGAAENKVLISKLKDSPVKQIEYNYSDDKVTFVFENGETHTFDYASIDY